MIPISVITYKNRRNFCHNSLCLWIAHLHTIVVPGEKLKKMKGSGGCAFYNEDNMEMLKSELLSAVHDVEELVSDGKDFAACPYYTARRAIRHAQVVGNVPLVWVIYRIRFSKKTSHFSVTCYELQTLFPANWHITHRTSFDAESIKKN